MNPRKNIWYYFFAGILVGALGGGLLVYFGSVISSQDKVSVSLVPGIIRDVMDMMRKDKETEASGEFTEKEKPSASEGQLSSNSGNHYQKEDSTALVNTGGMEDTLNSSEEDNEEIVIKRDEFILALPIEITNLDYKGNQKKQQKSDSLLSQNSGIRENTKENINDPKFSFEVEYWQSPINYRGYRLGVNKFVFFGMDPDEPISAYFWRGNYYLKWRDNFYLLKENEEFEAFEKINPPELVTLTKK